jgi:hypothetical protein
LFTIKFYIYKIIDMIDKLVKDFIQKTIIEIKKKENKDVIETEILNPIFTSFTEKIYPYVSLLFIMYCLNLVLIIVILILIILYNKKNI